MTGQHRMGPVETELVHRVAHAALQRGFLLGGIAEHVYTHHPRYPYRVVIPAAIWEEATVHELLTRHWLTRGDTKRVTCDGVWLTATTITVPPATRTRLQRWQRHHSPDGGHPDSGHGPGGQR